MKNKINITFIIYGIVLLLHALLYMHFSNYSNISVFLLTIAGAIFVYIGENSK